MFRRIDKPALLVSDQLDAVAIDPPSVLLSQQKFDAIIGSRIARERALMHEQLDGLQAQLADLEAQVREEARS